MTRWIVGFITLGITACGCGASPKKAPGQPSVALDVTLEVIGRLGPGETSVPSGVTLEAGDRLRFRVRTTRPAHVYLLHVDTRGTPHVIFPAKETGAGARPATVMEVTVPATGWFRLDDDLGREAIYAVAADQPLYDVSSVVKARVAGALADEPKEAVVPPGPSASALGPAESRATSATHGGPPPIAAPERGAGDSLSGTRVAAVSPRRSRRLVRRGMVYEEAGEEAKGTGEAIVVHEFRFLHVARGERQRLAAPP